jgi:Holliday junction resolvasome RuvABC DNA-binding subunit
VRRALTGMGFRMAEAQRMVEQVEERHRHAADSPAIEQVLREALLLAPDFELAGPRLEM